MGAEGHASARPGHAGVRFLRVTSYVFTGAGQQSFLALIVAATAGRPPLPIGRRPLAPSSVNRQERVIENVVGDASTLTDAGSLIEVPVDAEINSALAIFFFGLR